jgi:hypothetical protein
VVLGIDLPLGAHAPGAHVEDRQQVHLAAIGADGAADGLAVRGSLLQQARQSGAGGGPGGAALLPLVPGDFGQFLRPGGRHGLQEAVKRLVERVRVDLREDPPEGPRAGRPDAAGQRVRPAAEDQQRLTGAAGCPFRDRGGRVVPGRGERAHRQGQHELQRVPPPGALARIRDQQQPLPQAQARRLAGEGSGQAIPGDVNQGR